MPDKFGGAANMMFSINWSGNNGGSYSWGDGDGDELTTCLYGLWKDVRSPPHPLPDSKWYYIGRSHLPDHAVTPTVSAQCAFCTGDQPPVP